MKSTENPLRLTSVDTGTELDTASVIAVVSASVVVVKPLVGVAAPLAGAETIMPAATWVAGLVPLTKTVSSRNQLPPLAWTAPDVRIGTPRS